MKLRLLMLITVTLVNCMASQAKSIIPDYESGITEVELGVEGISRICPTAIWDGWTFRDILFDRESKSVVVVVQLDDWDAQRGEKLKQVTDADALKEAEWIVANFMEAYEYLIKNPSIRCEGDFMLYLSLGTLLRQMEKDGTNLRIMFLKPDYWNQVYGDIPMTLTSDLLKDMTSKMESE